MNSSHQMLGTQLDQTRRVKNKKEPRTNKSTRTKLTDCNSDRVPWEYRRRQNKFTWFQAGMQVLTAERVRVKTIAGIGSFLAYQLLLPRRQIAEIVQIRQITHFRKITKSKPKPKLKLELCCFSFFLFFFSIFLFVCWFFFFRFNFQLNSIFLF